MKKILLFISILLSGCVFAQDVSICELPLTTTVSPNDLLIIERADCSDPNGTQAIKINDLISSSTQSSAPLYFVLAATTGSLNMTYASDTLTAVSNGRLANQDGIKLMPNDSVLFKDQASQLQNGIYIVLDTGTVSTPAKLYRNPFYNTTAEVSPSQVNILSGTINGGCFFLQTTANPIVGTNPLVFLKSPTRSIVAGTGIAVANGVNTTTVSLNMCQSNTTTIQCNNIEIGNSINPAINRISIKNGGSLKLSGNAGRYLDFQNSGNTYFNTGNLFHSNTGILSISSSSDILIHGQNEHTSLYHGNHGATTAGEISIKEDSINIISDTGGIYLRSPEKIVLITPTGADSINLSRNPPLNDNSKQIATTAWTNSVIAAIPIGWSVTGNSGTTPGTNFLGTTDNQSLIFKVNNVQAGKITSNSNTSFGYQSLLVTGDNLYNTAIGSRALVNSTTGRENTCVGNQAGEDITTGWRNTLVGHQAGQNGGIFTGNRNTGVGLVVMGGNQTSVNVSGNENVAMGYQSLGKLSTGSYNTAIGSQALTLNTTGSENTGIGLQSMSSLTTGNNNTGVGNLSLGSTTTSSRNTGIGYGALFSNITGAGNTAIGFAAGVLSTGSGNVFVGDSAGYNETGSNKLYIANSSLNPLIYGDFSAKTLTVNGALTATTSVTTPSVAVTSSTASTFAGFDASKNLISGSLTYVGAGTTTVTTTGTAPTQTVTITGAATQTITLIGDATGSGTNTITVTNTYPTAWSSTTTITIGAVTTAPTKATTVQNDFVRYRTMSPVIGSTPKTVRADYMYSATSATGAAAGSGNYLFTLPDGFSFNSTEYTFYTGTSILSNINLSIYAINRGGPVGMLNGAGFYDWAIVVPYDATRFRLMPMGGTAPNAWVGSGWYQMDQTNKAFSLTFDFFAQ